LIVGIDLGTTYSAVATIGADGHPTALANSIGELTTPSVVYFESASSVLVGVAARSAAVPDPDNGVELIKRQMGTDARLLFHGATHTPESVSSLILRSLVADTLPAHDGPVRAVVTVPAYFGIREREATLQAARLAGIEVLELLAEPVAAALHYGTSPRSGYDHTRGGATLVYDLGGGTFDTTILTVGPDGLRVVATDGDSRLGGADWDERITTYLLENFVRATEDEDAYDDEQFLRHVDEAAEQAKRALSTTTARDVVLRKGSVRTTVPFDRKVLAELGSDLIERTMSIARRVSAHAAVHVDEVILVGGASRMPAVTEAITTELGMTPRLVEPDLAVVYGAAIRAHQLASQSSLTVAGGLMSALADKPTTSVVPRSFGVLLADSHDPSGTRELVVHTVHQNQPLPAETTTPFCTIVNGQDRVRVQVYEQAGDLPSEEVAHNRRVLDGELTGLPPLPAGARIDVTLRVSHDGLLSVTATEPNSGVTLTLEAYVDGVVDEAVTRKLETEMRGLTIRQ
jgi:molecular chaperone DnaK